MTADIYKQRISRETMQNTRFWEAMSFSIERTAAEWVCCKSVPHCPASGADAPLRRGILRTLRYTPLIFALQKKSTDSKPYGLPFVALAKDGGGKLNSSETISYAQVGCTDCKGTRTFDFFGKHL